MPVTVSAKKALRRDRRKAIVNQRIRLKIKKALREARANPTGKVLNQTASVLDRAAKKGVIPSNRAARLKSGLAKLAKKGQKKKKKKT
ncbi:MAG TPA: 30S ribosomal protein S20 [Candidatus Bathyarchaeia archaeon]|nr:30S ribosomal protein S20 [Candidatus Bathyarchaeia archaeon]